MGLVETAAAVIGALFTLVAGWLKLRGDHYKAQADQATQRANAAEATAQAHKDALDARVKAEQAQRETADKQAAAAKPADTEHRNDLEGSW